MATKTFLLGALAAMMLTGTALAADPFLPYPEAPIIDEPFDWSGFYVGVNGGYGGGPMSHPISLYGFPAPGILALDGPEPAEIPDGAISLIDGFADVTSGGGFAGGQIGFNKQFGNFVVGIEADAQWSNIEGSINIYGTDNVGFIGDEGDSLDIWAGTTIDWFATLRPKLGFAGENFMVYVTGGLAYGQSTSGLHFSGENDEGDPLFEPFDVEESLDRWGWTVGAGIETMLTDNISFKGEYLYTNFGQEQLADIELGDGFGIAVDSWIGFHAVRGGLNFHF